MSKALVQNIKDDLVARGVNISGPCGAFEIIKRVAWALRDEGYGLLGGKTPGQNGCTVEGERYSVDWILKPSGKGRDVLEDAGGRNEPQWGEEEDADPDLWRPAIDPGDDPVPTHKYIDGDNDTGICEVCEQSRTDPVHAISESKVRHGYDGGEHDTGLCDICQKPKNDPLHSDDLTQRLTALEAKVKALEAASVYYGTPIALRTENGHLICAEGGGGSEVNATRENVGGWETFSLEKGLLAARRVRLPRPSKSASRSLLFWAGGLAGALMFAKVWSDRQRR